MRFVLLVVLAFFPMFAVAQEAEMTPENSALCRILDRQNNVKGAAYQAGVDVNGNAVVPADLGGVSAFGLPDVMTIPLDISLQNRLKSLEEFGFDADTSLGVAEIYSDGKVSINGQDITAQTGMLCSKSQRIVTSVKEVPAPKVEPIANPAAPVVETIEKEPVDSMTSFAAERGILDKVMAEPEPEPKPKMTKEEIADELKSLVTDMNKLENNDGSALKKTSDDVIQGGDFRE